MITMSDFLKKEVTWQRRPAKIGSYFGFSIPMDFIRSGMIDINKTYEIHLKEVPDGEKKAEPREEEEEVDQLGGSVQPQKKRS